MPAQQLEEEETGRQTPTPTSQSDADIQSPEGRKVQYVDRVVEEILETEKTYVQDLRSIVQVRHKACAATYRWWHRADYLLKETNHIKAKLKE